jgi:hypothetical protein
MTAVSFAGSVDKKENIMEKNQTTCIENYSNPTIKSYSSALKLFLGYIETLQVEQVTSSQNILILEYLIPESSSYFFCFKKFENRE